MTSISNKLRIINNAIREAERQTHRKENSVQLLAVSKTKPSADIAQAYQAGQRHFGESYVQEALSKQQTLSCYDITWHFIGPIQSNKTRQIAHHFNWVHSVDRWKIAQRLSDQRPGFLPPLNICIQVNISDEESKSGFKLDEIADMSEKIAQLPNIKLRGVMAIPRPVVEYDEQCEPYHKLYQSIKTLKTLHHLNLDTFSFGMTGDLKAAIAEGSTIVRIGTALFGRRN